MSQVRRILIKTLAAATVFGVVLASAATLGSVSSGELGAGSGAVGSCEQDGISTAFSPEWEQDGVDGPRFVVSKVTVSGVAAACNTRKLEVRLTDSAGKSVGSGTQTVQNIPAGGDGSVDVTLSTKPAATVVSGVHVAIGG